MCKYARVPLKLDDRIGEEVHYSETPLRHFTMNFTRIFSMLFEGKNGANHDGPFVRLN